MVDPLYALEALVLTAPVWLPVAIASLVVLVKRRFSLAGLFAFVTVEAVGFGWMDWMFRNSF